MGNYADLVTPTVSQAVAFPISSNPISRRASLRVAQPDSRAIAISRAWLLDHIDSPAAFQNLHVESPGTIWNGASDVYATTRALVASDFVNIRTTIVDLNLDLTIDRT
jgi:hypothetical protein